MICPPFSNLSPENPSFSEQPINPINDTSKQSALLRLQPNQIPVQIAQSYLQMHKWSFENYFIEFSTKLLKEQERLTQKQSGYEVSNDSIEERQGWLLMAFVLKYQEMIHAAKQSSNLLARDNSLDHMFWFDSSLLSKMESIFKHSDEKNIKLSKPLVFLSQKLSVVTFHQHFQLQLYALQFLLRLQKIRCFYRKLRHFSNELIRIQNNTNLKNNCLNCKQELHQLQSHTNIFYQSNLPELKQIKQDIISISELYQFEQSLSNPSQYRHKLFDLEYCIKLLKIQIFGSKKRKQAQDQGLSEKINCLQFVIENSGTDNLIKNIQTLKNRQSKNTTMFIRKDQKKSAQDIIRENVAKIIHVQRQVYNIYADSYQNSLIQDNKYHHQQSSHNHSLQMVSSIFDQKNHLKMQSFSCSLQSKSTKQSESQESSSRQSLSIEKAFEAESSERMDDFFNLKAQESLQNDSQIKKIALSSYNKAKYQNKRTSNDVDENIFFKEIKKIKKQKKIEKKKRHSQSHSQSYNHQHSQSKLNIKYSNEGNIILQADQQTNEQQYLRFLDRKQKQVLQIRTKQQKYLGKAQTHHIQKEEEQDVKEDQQNIDECNNNNNDEDDNLRQIIQEQHINRNQNENEEQNPLQLKIYPDNDDDLVEEEDQQENDELCVENVQENQEIQNKNDLEQKEKMFLEQQQKDDDKDVECQNNIGFQTPPIKVLVPEPESLKDLDIVIVFKDQCEGGEEDENVPEAQAGAKNENEEEENAKDLQYQNSHSKADQEEKISSVQQKKNQISKKNSNKIYDISSVNKITHNHSKVSSKQKYTLLNNQFAPQSRGHASNRFNSHTKSQFRSTRQLKQRTARLHHNRKGYGMSVHGHEFDYGYDAFLMRNKRIEDIGDVNDDDEDYLIGATPPKHKRH